MASDENLWYKDAVFYELHVKAFQDSNADGVGDFKGLMQRLDYVEELGVDVIWLLPCYPSPLRDDGYDIADYLGIHSQYGTLEDFDRFIEEAHRRGLRVVTDLVMNHTSDQHPWFQRARRAPKGSPERDFYVWSDTDERYEDARIIFTDTETSNWTWDPVAEQYFWHRFFSHQPDLNWDNPAVLEAMLEVIDFWLERGLDGFRCDAVPYLIEREGTNCENLPETHEILKKVRTHIDEHHPGRIILAEANQWPDDVRPYFGDGDEFQMAFHFPLMPRIFMSVRQGIRKPIVEIIERTPDIPDSCQWCMFLRNHDELTLEMVTDEERDYMYAEYASDPRMKINVGIRRRLAPLLDNDRRKIELLNSILFTMPGSPIIYYGDEIGMGDNIYLGDRDGVRTPMQWSPDRNAGFSGAEAARLYLPAIVDSIYGYQGINVEAQQKSPFSLLNWMRRLVRVRKRHKAFGRGSIEFLDAENPHILAYVRRYEDDDILLVHNLSGAAQAVRLDLSQFAGRIPVEILGETEFLPIEDDPYSVTLGPYGFFWFALRPEGAEEELSPDVRLATRTEAAGLVERIPHDWLQGRRWFRDKGRTIESLELIDLFPLDIPDMPRAMAVMRVEFESGPRSDYILALAPVEGTEEADLHIDVGGSAMSLRDAGEGVNFNRALVELIREEDESPGAEGVLRGVRIGEEEVEPVETVRSVGVEQSNTAVIMDDRLFLKLYRRLEVGVTPDLELPRFLYERTDFRAFPAPLGYLEYRTQGGERTVVGVLTEYIPNEGDGWSWFRRRLREGGEAGSREDLKAEAEAIGRVTGAMHRALGSASPEVPDMHPVEASEDRLERWTDALQSRADRLLDAFSERLESAPDAFDEDTRQAVRGVVESRERIRDRLQRLEVAGGMGVHAIRVHGDYHLGQVLRGKDGGWLVVDFEGEVTRPLGERRTLQVALRDVAGMTRSFSYLAEDVRRGYTEAGDEPPKWLDQWEDEARASFLRGYREAVDEAGLAPDDDQRFADVLSVYELDKALYELDYELGNRPEWVAIPTRGIERLLEDGSGD